LFGIWQTGVTAWILSFYDIKPSNSQVIWYHTTGGFTSPATRVAGRCDPRRDRNAIPALYPAPFSTGGFTFRLWWFKPAFWWGLEHFCSNHQYAK